MTIKGFCVIIDTSKPQGKFKEIDYGIRNYCFALGVRYYGRNVPVQIDRMGIVQGAVQGERFLLRVG